MQKLNNRSYPYALSTRADFKRQLRKKKNKKVAFYLSRHLEAM